MAFPNIFKMLFANGGAGPLLREDILPPMAAATSAAPGVVQLATATEALAETNAVKAITPATLKSAFSQYLGGSGWYRLPGGLIFQWINASATWTGSGPYQCVVTLPVAFPSICILACAQDYNTAPAAAGFASMRWISSLGNRVTTIGLEAAQNPFGFSVFAIGR